MAGVPPKERLGCSHLAGARPLVAALDIEAHALSAAEAVEVKRAVEAAAMEEVLLSIVGGDEAEAAVAHDLFDVTSQHLVSPIPSRE